MYVYMFFVDSLIYQFLSLIHESVLGIGSLLPTWNAELQNAQATQVSFILRDSSPRLLSDPWEKRRYFLGLMVIS